MSERAKEMLSLELPCDAAAPGIVREALEQLDDLGWVLGDVMLVASELVTNAVLHSGCPPDFPLRVRVYQKGPETITISVSDPGLSGGEARPRPADEFADGGWGLKIVEQLAVRWAAERSDGYRVWADVALVKPEADRAQGTYLLLL